MNSTAIIRSQAVSQVHIIGLSSPNSNVINAHGIAAGCSRCRGRLSRLCIGKRTTHRDIQDDEMAFVDRLLPRRSTDLILVDGK
jgi:hypothetical protein